MSWVKKGKYCFITECGRFALAKVFLQGDPNYSLTDGQKLIGFFKTSEAAIAKKKEIIDKEQRDNKGSESDIPRSK